MRIEADSGIPATEERKKYIQFQFLKSIRPFKYLNENKLTSLEKLKIYVTPRKVTNPRNFDVGNIQKTRLSFGEEV